MSIYTVTAAEVTVGEILIDEDHEAWYVDDVEQVESTRGTTGVRFLLRSVEDNSERTEGYGLHEIVTLDAQDEEGEPFEESLWRATAPPTE